jgi:hypothetical protein
MCQVRCDIPRGMRNDQQSGRDVSEKQDGIYESSGQPTRRIFNTLHRQLLFTTLTAMTRVNGNHMRFRIFLLRSEKPALGARIDAVLLTLRGTVHPCGSSNNSARQTPRLTTMVFPANIFL